MSGDKVEFTLDVRDCIAALQRLNGDASEGLKRAALAGGMVIQAGMKRRITQGGKSGRLYQRGRKQHQASAPGEPPASDTGALANSIVARISKSDADYAESETGPTMAYDEALEFGASRMAARPYARPTLDEDADQIQAAIEAALQRALQRAMP
jgi:hypothetical protein